VEEIGPGLISNIFLEFCLEGLRKTTKTLDQDIQPRRVRRAPSNPSAPWRVTTSSTFV